MTTVFSFWAQSLKDLSELSDNNAPYDIKMYLGMTKGFFYGTVNGKRMYTTGRAAGNILFGKNVHSIYQNAWSLNDKQAFYEFVFAVVGAKNIVTNKVKPPNTDFYGEHPYSGSFQYLGS